MRPARQEFDAKQGEEYTCLKCYKTFLAGTREIQCCVGHSPGSCCHYTDKQVEE